jgi:dTDP-4-dehydrorhamnose reductase
MMPQPYFEDDTPRPISAYGKSKMESEKAVRENAPNYIIIRTGWLYGMGGNNFIKSIVAQAVQKKKKVIRVVEDQFGSPTWTYRLALQIKELLDQDGRGTYHATAEGYCSRYECAVRILEKLGIKKSIEPCSMNSFRQGAGRPVNCLLENRRLKKQGISLMKNWREDLDEFLDQYGDELVKQARKAKA